MLTLQEAKEHCRIDGDDFNDKLVMNIAAATAFIEGYIGITYGLGQAPAPVKAACCLLVADLFENLVLQAGDALYTNRTFYLLLNQYLVLAA